MAGSRLQLSSKGTPVLVASTAAAPQTTPKIVLRRARTIFGNMHATMHPGVIETRVHENYTARRSASQINGPTDRQDRR